MTAAAQARKQADDAQRRAADPEASVWVAASAGTGKTKVLTDRVLSLMLHGTLPIRILCLTFTKAAAAEMANRLAQRLGRWAIMTEADLIEDIAALLGAPPDDDTLARARALFARVLDAPGGMKIQTIHAFCQSLLGRFPLEAGIAPHFQVLDERSAAEMLEQAREEVLAAAQGGDGEDETAQALAAALAEITLHVQEQSFTELMAALIRERGRLKRLLRQYDGIAGLEDAMFRVMGVGDQDAKDHVLADACTDDAFDLMGLRLAAGAMIEGGKTDREHGARIAAWLAEPDQREAKFEDYLGAFFTKKDGRVGEGDPFKTLVHKEALAAAPGIDSVLDGETQRLAAVRAKLRDITVACATAALLRLGDTILEAYERHKKVRALLDYDDLILGARDLLDRPGIAAWVLYKLDGGLDHVLIDEAQDTNPEQWQVIDALTAEFFAGEGAREGPRTVFAVGDAKQSIYSFQRANPAEFAHMRDHFAERARDAAQRWEKVDLGVSFRSSKAVLDAVDMVFAGDPARDGVLFGEERLTHRPVRVGQAGLVELWPPAVPLDEAETAPWEPPVDRRGGAPARARLAELIARRIWRWTTAAEGATDPEALLESKARRLRPGDILVLVRRRNEFVEELVRALKRLKVPVAGVDRMVLRDQLAVMDLVALGRVLLLPSDDLTLATVLKGPLIGLSEEQLFTLAYERNGTLWDSLGAHAKRDPAFRAARDHLGELLAQADFMPPYELFAEVLTRDWGGIRGRRRLLARLGPDAADPIEEFLSLALAYEREHVPSLEGFLHWIEVGAQEVKRDMEHGQDSVRVMTVHGAKGLQAPVIFLPDTMQVPKAKSGLFWLEDEGGLPLWPLRRDYDGPVAAHARAAAKTAQDAEYRRLLYVAMTRAEDRLYICGWETKAATPEDCWYRLVEPALARAGEARQFDFTADIAGGWAGPGWRLASAQTAKAEADKPAPALHRAAEPLPGWTQEAPPPEPAPPRPLAPSRPRTQDPAVRSPLGPDQGRRFQRGLLIHRLLQSLPELPPERRPAAAERFLASPLHGLAAEERREIQHAALAVLEDPVFADLFGLGSQAEVPLVGMIESDRGTEIVSGQVDRLIVTEENILIVDYKTNRPAPNSEALAPALYLQQMAVYRAVLAGLYPDRRIDCALLWTDGPRLMQLSDAILSRHAP